MDRFFFIVELDTKTHKKDNTLIGFFLDETHKSQTLELDDQYLKFDNEKTYNPSKLQNYEF